MSRFVPGKCVIISKMAKVIARLTAVRHICFFISRGALKRAPLFFTMTNNEIDFAKEAADKDIHKFYTCGKWKKLRAAVLELDKHECQLCRSRGKYTKATTVHHVNYVKQHPELALEIWYEWQGERKRNLISLCRDCHEEVHGYRKKASNKPLITDERW